ncbi:hypothetical protein [Streptomyces sp. NPDC093099]|uniref:hypothetical protein n=1 Tax=Streptomyces sp. NPDC093099 TaxID=3366028 RepID=UPI00381F9299
MGFEVSDAFVHESVVLAGAGQALLNLLVVLGELSYVLLQRGVLGDDALEGALGEVVFEVADLAEEFCDVGALGADFALGLGECVFGVERTFLPGGLGAAAAVGDCGVGSACAGGLLDQGSGLLVLIEEGA